MLVILTDEQILSPQQVCQSCLLADRSGQPRWRQGKLGCGHLVRKLTENQPEQYECEMGFRVAYVE
ncbi:MAG: hypothetical protein KME06_09160 [Kastovskya adunca ATA6-11-RM4]|jgi:hypothetical protein|nr:hypothetical protein [Kastovskya adunca ATA6-11-RM4]